MANNTKDLCSKKFSLDVLIILLSGIFFGLESFCAIKRLFAFSLSVTSLSQAARAIPHESFLRRNRNRIVEKINEIKDAKNRFILVIDDTFCRKFGATEDNCYWFDHSLNTTLKGRNYLVIILLDTHTGQRFPLSVVLLYGKKHPQYQPRLTVLKKELLTLKKIGLGSFTVVADSWFAGADFFKWLEEQDFIFEIEVKQNRKITYFDKKQQGILDPKGKLKYPTIQDVAMSLKWRNTAYSGGAPKRVNGGVIRMYGSALRLKFVAVWNQNSSFETKPFAIYLTNKTEMCLSRVWALSRFRWGIECHFRASKQVFCFDKFPIHSAETALKIIVLGMFLISSLELKRFVLHAKPQDKKTIRSTYESFERYVRKMRMEHEQKNFQNILLHERNKKRALEHMNTVQNKKFACLKPRDKINNQIIYEKAA